MTYLRHCRNFHQSHCFLQTELLRRSLEVRCVARNLQRIWRTPADISYCLAFLSENWLNRAYQYFKKSKECNVYISTFIYILYIVWLYLHFYVNIYIYIYILLCKSFQIPSPLSKTNQNFHWKRIQVPRDIVRSKSQFLGLLLGSQPMDIIDTMRNLSWTWLSEPPGFVAWRR